MLNCLVITVVFYADDLKKFCRIQKEYGCKNLQFDLVSFEELCSINKLNINISKLQLRHVVEEGNL